MLFNELIIVTNVDIFVKFLCLTANCWLAYMVIEIKTEYFL